MRLIDPSLRFLHCMRRREYLDLALSEGLRFTEHQVRFIPADDPDEMRALANEMVPLLMGKLESMGTPFGTLSEERKKALFMGLGVSQGQIPMICFTEIVPGRNLNWHRQMFGCYGIVPKAEWMARNDAERVIYVGNNSPASRQLFRIMATTHILGLLPQDGEPLFDNLTLATTTPLISYVEVRDNVAEVEWRIAGGTGFFGETRATGTKLPLLLRDIDFILVPDTELSEVQALVVGLARKQGCTSSPRVMAFPGVMP